MSIRDQITKEYVRRRLLLEGTKKRLPKGCLEGIIKKYTAGVSDDIKITCHTIKSRYHRYSKSCGFGNLSPVAALEPILANFLIALGHSRNPQPVSIVIQVANDLIQGTEIETNMLEWRDEQQPNHVNSKLTYAWYRAFLNRYRDVLIASPGRGFGNSRHTWCTYLNFREMYDAIYAEMVRMRVAYEIDPPVWVDRKGVEVCDEKDAYGRMITHKLRYPGMVLVFDETGCNTSQEKDGRRGNEKFVCARGSTPEKRISTKSNHFTVIGITLLDGTTVMCVVIFAATILRGHEATGYDQFAEQVGHENDPDFIQKNTGKGKLFPGGPTCTVDGKVFPTLVWWTPSGTVTGEILVDIFSALDALNLMDRTTGATPMAILDGHSSRFHTDLLRYIHDIKHRWGLTVGLPYATNKWQIGDTIYQNGMFSMSLNRAKNNLFERKCKHNLLPQIERHEILLLVDQAWG